MSRLTAIVILLLGLFVSGCASIDTLIGEATAEDTETAGVDVPGVPTLTVNHFAGQITVRTGEDGHITANLTKYSRLDDKAAAQAQLEAIEMSFSQNNTDVVLDVKEPDTAGGGINGPMGDLELLVPAGTALMLNLGAGDVTVEQPTGDVNINSGAGQATVSLPADASFHLVIAGGVADVSSDFEGVPDGGVAADIDTTIGDNPTQTLTFNLGAGEVHLQKAP